MVSLRGVWDFSAGLVVEVVARPVSGRFFAGVRVDRALAAFDDVCLVVEPERFAVVLLFFAGLVVDFVARFFTAGAGWVVSARLDRDPSRVAAFAPVDRPVPVLPVPDPADLVDLLVPVDAEPDDRPPLAGGFFAEAFLAALIVGPPFGAFGVVRLSG